VAVFGVAPKTVSQTEWFHPTPVGGEGETFPASLAILPTGLAGQPIEWLKTQLVKSSPRGKDAGEGGRQNQIHPFVQPKLNLMAAFLGELPAKRSWRPNFSARRN
jgi:hypothetical protein